MKKLPKSDRSFDRLKAAISPPESPINNSRSALPVDLPALPEELFAFLDAYGSGHFDLQGSNFLTVLNPFDCDYWVKQNRDLQLLRRV